MGFDLLCRFVVEGFGIVMLVVIVVGLGIMVMLFI